MRSNFLTLFLFSIILFSSFGSAGFFDWWGNITGNAVSDTTTLSITVGNNAPTISSIQSISAQSPRELDHRTVAFNFNVSDADGVANINDSTAKAEFNRAGEVSRLDTSCTWVRDYSPNTAEYSCSIDMWYFDGSGAWNINVSASDINSAEARNDSTTFTYNQLTSMVMSPVSMSWSTLALTDTNVGSNNDPIVINNTGNDVNLGVDINSRDLQGLTTTSEYIYAENFSVGVVSEGCGGTAMVDSVATSVGSAIVQKGNNTLNNNDATSGQEELFFCLRGLPKTISAQEYSTGGTGPWTIQVIT